MELAARFAFRFIMGILLDCKSRLSLLLSTIFRSISKETRTRWAVAGGRIFQVLFTYYRLSRIILLLTLDFIYHKFTIHIRRMKKYYKQKQQSVSEDESCSWNMELPEHIMQLIIRRLYVSDYFRCRAVSHSWQAMVDMAISSNFYRPAPQLPWLMLCSHPSSIDESCFLSLSDSQKFTCKSFPGHMNRRDCVGSIEEWLIMVDSAVWRPEGFMKPWSLYLQCNSIPIDYFFLNPISGSTVMLPSSPSTLPCDCDYTPLFLFAKVVASSVPTNQHCFVASLCKRGHLAFCRPADRLWTFIDGSFIDQGEARNLLFQDVEIFDGKLYAATWDASNFLMVFDIQYDNGIPRYTTEKLVMLHPNPVPNMFLNVTITNNGVRVETNRELISLAKDSTSHELFMIFRRHNFAFEEDPIFPWHAIFGGTFIIPPHIQGFRVFKLERHLKGPRWVEVFNLGDQILFVSRAGNKFISSSNISDYNEAFERNCIYFAFNNPCFASPSLGLDVGVFSLANKSIRCFTFPKDHSRSQLHSRPVWFMPKFWSFMTRKRTAQGEISPCQKGKDREQILE